LLIFLGEMTLLKTLENLLFYNTIKVVQIRNWKLGILHYSIQAIIILYVVCWVIIWNKGYQGSGPLIGCASPKVKGSAYYAFNNSIEVWDEYDVVYPFKEQDAFFITTNYQVTYGQQRGLCYDNSSLSCNETCPFNMSVGAGITNGTCSDDGFCWMYAWCPMESIIAESKPLTGIPEFTVFTKINAKFPTYNVLVDNIGNNLNPGVNFWSINEMLGNASVDYDSVNLEGTVIVIIVDWNCDLDHSINNCNPSFTFTRYEEK